MTSENLIQELEQYRAELADIKSRFALHDNDMIYFHHIKPEDEPRFKTIVIEIIDLLNDSIGRNKYSALINQFFNEGMSNYYNKPSITSVENIIPVLDSVITRMRRNPELCKPKDKSQMKTEKGIIDTPQKTDRAKADIHIEHSTITFGNENRINHKSSQNIQTKKTATKIPKIVGVIIKVITGVVIGIIVWYLTHS